MKSIGKKEWGKLWNEAWLAYQDYVAKANETFQLLSDVKFPVSIEKRLEILNQRRTENGARERLQVARNRLFACLNSSQIHPLGNVDLIAPAEAR